MYLNAHSYYSLRYGTLSIEDLVKESSKRGIKTIALTDINNSTGIFDFVKLCRKEKIKPVPGIDFRDGNQQLYIGLAENNEGFRELNNFLSRHHLSNTPLPRFAPAFKNVRVIYPFGSRLPGNLRDNEFIGIPPYAVRKLISSKLPRSKMVILQNATFTDKEGYEVAEWLNSLGFTVFVLQYRVPDKQAGALMDVQRAIRIVRARADEWNLDGNKLGVMGFSAGGSLSARASTLYDLESYESIDDMDEVSCRPDFSILIYPAYLDKGDNRSLTPELKVDEKTPPMFIFGTADDHYANSALVMASALRDAKVPVELHLLPSGGHGYGLRPGNIAAETWPGLLREWLEQVVTNDKKNDK